MDIEDVRDITTMQQETSLKSIQTMQWVQTGVTALALFLGGTLYIKSQSKAADDWAAPSNRDDSNYLEMNNDIISSDFIRDQYKEYLETT